MPSAIKAFPFLFHLQNTSGTETRKGRKRERKNDSQTQRPNPRRSGEIAPLSSQFAPPISLFLDLPLPFELGLIVAASCLSRSRLRIDRDRSTALIAIAVPRHVISPLVEPSCLSLFLLLSIWPDLMIFFFSGFCLCFCIEEWMILYICLAVEKMWATSRKCVFYDIFKNTTKH